MLKDHVQIFFDNYDYRRSIQWLQDHQTFMLVTIVVYLTTILGIRRWLENRKGFELRTALTLWNAGQAVFSVIGVMNTAPMLWHVIQTHGFSYTYTHINEFHRDPQAGYWAFLWVVSKFTDLGDTIFIVLRKRPLTLMHVWHHVAAVFGVFISYSLGNAFLDWYVTLNYLVHSWMYTYFALRAMNFNVPGRAAELVTLAQILQMSFWNMLFAHLIYLILTTNEQIDVTAFGLSFGIFGTDTLLYLWFSFYYDSYYKNGGKKYSLHNSN
ncbi:Elongation of very long chain fatty acids protein [Aphelenchoides besseyi]|nr:Elongation of very long chain fatty acids protein [Aphelenchoides besseyi]